MSSPTSRDGPYKAAIFDIDGVMLSTPHERAWRESLEELMATTWAQLQPLTRYRPDRFTSQVYQELVAGQPRLDGAYAALVYFNVPGAEQRAAQFAERKQHRFTELISGGEVTCFPDAVRFAVALKQRGVLIAAASSSKNATGLLRRLKLQDVVGANLATRTKRAKLETLWDLFDVDVSGRDLSEGKPNPSLFLLAASELAVAPRACFVVEDAPSGIRAAIAAGMRAVGVARVNDAEGLRAAGAHVVVASLDDVDLDVLLLGA